jgi:hypothetical protein
LAVVREESGLNYFDVQPGTGPTPKWGQLLVVNYAGYTVRGDGTLRCFDSTYDRREPYLLKHGNGQTVKGVELALHSMAVGGRRRVELPQETLGYVFGALGPLPPGRRARENLQEEINETERAGRQINLVFDLELLSAMDDVNDRGYYDDVTITVEQQERGVPLDAVLADPALRNGGPL